MESKMIELVRSYRMLYDNEDIQYTDNEHKNKVWADIAAECNLSTGDEAKETWKKLRDGYRCCLKRMKNTKRTWGGTNPKLWRFYRAMSFLQPYMRDRPRKMLASDQHSELSIETLSIPNESETEEPTELLVDPTPPKMNRTETEMDTDLLEFLRKQSEAREERAKSRDEIRRLTLQPLDGLKLFFDSMYETTKTLPYPLQKKVKKALFQVVSEAEDLAETWPSCSYSNSVSN